MERSLRLKNNLSTLSLQTTTQRVTSERPQPPDTQDPRHPYALGHFPKNRTRRPYKPIRACEGGKDIQRLRRAPQASYGRQIRDLGDTRCSMKRLTILPGMENVGDKQSIRRDLIANFIVIHDEAPDLTG